MAVVNDKIQDLYGLTPLQEGMLSKMLILLIVVLKLII